MTHEITTVLVYRREAVHDAQGSVALAKEVFLTPAYAQDLETEQLSWEEAKDISRTIREAGKAVDNQVQRWMKCAIAKRF